MRRALLVVLSLSLFANAWLVWSARRSATAGAPTNAAATAAVPDRAQAAVPSSSAPATDGEPGASHAAAGAMWRELRTEDDYRRLADELRAAGFPAHLVYRVLQEVYDQRLRRESPIFKAPFWQRRSVANSAEAREHEKQREARTEQLFGTVARADKVDPSWRARRYGDLSTEKIAAISAIEWDYSEMNRTMRRPGPAGPVTVEDLTARQEQGELLRSELRADLAKVLTPTELAAYELRSSTSAQATARMLQDVTLTAEEFSALARARETYDAAVNRQTGPAAGAEGVMRAQLGAQAAYVEELRATLADDRFYTALEGFDPTYRSVAALRNQFPSVTPAKAYDAMQLRREMQTALSSLGASGPTREAIEAEFARWNTRLDTVLGADAAAAFRQTEAGREFVLPATRRSAQPPRG